MDKTKADVDYAWAEWMMEERERLGYSQSELARRVEATRQTINDYEAKRRANPDPAILSRISAALGKDPLYLPRMANLIPPDDKEDDVLKRIRHIYNQLSTDAKKRGAEFFEFLIGMEKKSGRK